jgi:hypothetical protein
MGRVGKSFLKASKDFADKNNLIVDEAVELIKKKCQCKI